MFYKAKTTLVALASLCLAAGSLAQVQQEAEWTARVVPADARAGESAQLVLTAKIKKDWHIYSIVPAEGIGPLPTSFEFVAMGLKAEGDPIEPSPIVKVDPNFGDIKVGMFEGDVAFAIPVQVTGSATGKATARWMACSESTCSPPRTSEIPIDFKVTPGPARADHITRITTAPEQPVGAIVATTGDEPPVAGQVSGEANSGDIEEALKKGLLPFLLISFIAGLGALLTPCVFPMVPITVSYFSKRAEDKKPSIAGAAAYSLGIISTFTVLGVLVAIIFGGSAIAAFATHPITNIVLALLFVVLALNLFGVYEIRLPSWLVNKANQGTKKGGFFGPFAMGLTFTLTSFTCTVGFVGALLAKAAAGGSILMPILGMLSFSFAFASPFFLLALFPQYLSNLPKAGSWMTSVKVTMGFIELAAAVKFLSNADLVWQLGWLTKPIFLATWAIIFVMGGLYLLGWITLPTEPSPSKKGIPRLAIGSLFAFVGVYCLAAIEGAPTGEISSFLPPHPYPGRQALDSAPIKWEEKYEVALVRAKAENKPLLINFTGVTCTNCRWMEQNMFPRPEIAKAVNDQFVPVELWTDRPGDEPNQKLQIRLTGLDTLPIYVVVSPEGKAVRRFEGSTRNSESFLSFLTQDSAVASR
ncbi:MAG: thioredoxin family protein [Armatimonadetes bacterium]|nr:thioredoxin family protein [Armatimonadota bacterium]